MGTDSLDHSRQIVCVEYESEKSPERGLLERVDNYKRTLGMSMKEGLEYYFLIALSRTKQNSNKFRSNQREKHK